MTVYAQPGTDGSPVTYQARYENWIGGKWVPPVKGQYFENPSPVTGKTFCEVARGTAEDIDVAPGPAPVLRACGVGPCSMSARLPEAAE